MRLREFEMGDLPPVMELVSDSLRERYEPSLYQSLAESWPEAFLVAVDASNRVVGFLLGVNQVPHEARVLMFAVDRDHRGRGVGSLLMEAFLERARARGLTRATLEVRVGNATAIRFYSRYRFGVVDLLRGYYADGENGYQMARDLV